MSITAILRATKRFTYGIYAWIALIAVLVPALAVLAVMPTRRWRRFVTHWAAKIYFALIASPVGVHGARLLPDAPCVLIANHASYLDGMILTAALPPRFTFLIKQEMASLPFAGYLLKRIGSEFVDREDGRHRHRVARRLLKAAQSGDSLAFFPEGTFDEAPGLKRFQAGAFGAAWRARLPVVPVVISGSRAKMPAQVWLPAPGPVSIRVCEPVEPAAQDSATELLSASRQRLLEWLEEPDLARTSVGSSPPADDP
jgi:1-acyl-sn-glycerol-3-phosphate acyltransferase